MVLIAAVAYAVPQPYVINGYEVSYKIEDQPNADYLSHPHYFFSGRELEIKKIGGTSDSSLRSLETVVLNKKVFFNLITSKSMQIEVERSETEEENSAVIEIPEDLASGDYEIQFDDGGTQKLPLYIIGVQTLNSRSAQREPTINLDPSIFNIKRTGYCYWELTSGMSPVNEDYGYLSNYDCLVQSTDGWQTSTQYTVDELVDPLILNDRGDDKLTFGTDGRLVVASLFVNSSDLTQPITGGLYVEKTPLAVPPEFNQIQMAYRPRNLDPAPWIIFDYEKASVDTDPSSPYYGNIYEFANAALMDDPYDPSRYISVQAVVILHPDGSIYRYNRTGGIAVTSTVVGPHGVLYAAVPGGFSSGDTGYRTVGVSMDGGHTFTSYPIDTSETRWCPGRVSTTSDRAIYNYRGPELTVDAGGRLYAAWSEPQQCITDPDFEYGEYGYDYEVYVAHSDDEGQHWSPPVKVSNDLSGGDQSFPSIKTDDNGTVFVAFLDHRDNKDQDIFDVYITYSTDGGTTFSKDAKANDLSVPNVFGGRNPGDYLDMLGVGPTKVYVAHPCVDPENSYPYSPSNACVTVVDKELLLESPVVITCGNYQMAGDANGDGFITAEDTTLVANAMVGNLPLPNDLCCIDLDQDGNITATDVAKVQNIVAALDTTPGLCIDGTVQARCGDNIREAPEECDATDDALCPNRCSQSCSCLPMSAVFNNGGSEISGELTLTLQKNDSGQWVTARSVVSKPITVAPYDEYALDQEWNQWHISAYTPGVYRAYAEFNDGSGTIDSGYIFTVSPVDQCNDDGDCPSGESWYCFGNDACSDTTTYQCNNGQCVQQVGGGGICQACPNGCSDGYCNQLRFQEDPSSSNVTDNYVLVTYTKPAGAINAIWEVKHGFNKTSNVPFHYNISIPVACFNEDPLQFRIKSDTGRTGGYGGSVSQPECYNGSNYVLLGIKSSGSAVSSCINGGTQSSQEAIDGDWSTETKFGYCPPTDRYEWYHGGIPGYASIFEEGVWWELK